MNSAPTARVRAAWLQQLIRDMSARDPAMQPLLPLLNTPRDSQGTLSWQLPIGPRDVTVTLPVRGEDGGYFIVIQGEALPLLKMKLDQYAHQYHFHRLSTPEEPAKFTLEWRGTGDTEEAMYTVYFLLLLCRLLPALPR